MPRVHRGRTTAPHKRALEMIDLAGFVSAVGRTSRWNGLDPNDRSFDPDMSKKLRQMPPHEFDSLLRDDGS